MQRICLKKNAMTFFQNSTTQENIRISILKKRLKKLCKKENFTPESKPMTEFSRMNYVNRKVNMQKVQNFMQIL